jgi:hypothetical protein
MSMTFQVSPGINVSEVDLTTTVPAVATAVGGFAGPFNWGPVGKFSLITGENDLVARYGKPNNDNFESFFSAANYLAYANRLYVSRAAKTSGFSNNASSALTGNTYLIAYSSAVGVQAGYGAFGAGIPEGATVVSANNSALSNNFNANTAVAANGQISLADNPFVTGETVQYLVAAGNTAITELANASTYFVRGSNSTSLYLSATVDGSVLSLTKGVTESGHSLTRTGVTRVVLSANVTSGNVASPSLTTVNYFDTDLSFNAFANSAAVTNRSAAIVKNSDHYETVTFPAGVEWVAKYPSAQGNSLKVSVCDTANQYQSTLNPYSMTAGGVSSNGSVVPGGAGITVALNANTATIYVANSATLHSSNAAILAQGLKDSLIVGDVLEVGNNSINKQKLKITSIGTVSTSTGNSSFVVNFEGNYALSTAYTANTISRFWEYASVVGKAPGTSPAVVAINGTVVDELHVVVVDEDGKFSGSPGTVLEVFSNLSRATDARNDDGSSGYYKTAINDLSRYLWWAADRSGAASAAAVSVAASSALVPYTVSLSGGSSGATESELAAADLAAAWDLFADTSSVDVSLLIAGKAAGASGIQMANYVIDNIAETRKDCVAFISPQKSDVVRTDGAEADSVVAFRNGLRSTSYAVMDSGYKYQYDKYNDVYRYVPLNGDIAGLTARTDQTRDPWFSPAGFNRGSIKNVVKLAWNPKQAERDVLYAKGIDPVVTFPGQGTILFGDKTLLAKESAFNRINVRRLFIILEKAIANAANAMLFEFNDEFTRAQFKNLVEPFLRDVQGRRGIYDFRVVCDETNNTAEVVDSNRFVGDIYIKPAKSINFIQLNFVAVRTGVEFDEIIGQF